MLHVPQGYNWYFDSQKRIGERVAILAVLDVAGRGGGRCLRPPGEQDPCSCQTLQMRALLDAVDRLPPGIPVFMGDFNTNTYDGAGLEAAGHSIREQHLGHAAPGCGRLRATAARGGRGGFFLLGLQRPSCQAPQETPCLTAYCRCIWSGFFCGD